MSEARQEPTQDQTNTSSQGNSGTLRRSDSNVIVGGVAAGLAEYFAIDPTVVRLGFVLLAFVNGFGVLAYIVLWLIMPGNDSHQSRNSQDQIKENLDEIGRTVSHQVQRIQGPEARSWWGWLLVAIGVFFIVINFGLLDLLQLHIYWPLILILLGLAFILRR